MKKKFALLVLGVCFATMAWGQYGRTDVLNWVGKDAFNGLIPGGFYWTSESQIDYPSISWPYPYRYLIQVQGGDNTVDNFASFQISSSYTADDRVFFRKNIYYNPNTKWIEFATRGENIFKGSQYVNGTLYANEVRVETTQWADFVFKPEYKLPALSEVKAHIDEHKHLPGIPSEAEVKENGVNLSEMTTKLLQKVEELTLYAIQQQETIEKLNSEIQDLKNSK